jgi:hypothetical protein
MGYYSVAFRSLIFVCSKFNKTCNGFAASECFTVFQSHTETLAVYSPAMDDAPVATISSNKTYTQQQAPIQTAISRSRSRRTQYVAAIVGKSAVRLITANCT